MHLGTKIGEGVGVVSENESKTFTRPLRSATKIRPSGENRSVAAGKPADDRRFAETRAGLNVGTRRG